MTAPTNPDRTEPSDRDSWTVVVCAYTEDRWHLLREAVASIWLQTHQPSELVLVIDHNPALLARARSTFAGDRFRVVPNAGRRGLSGSRNTGVLEASTPLVAFLDDDAAAHPTWLEHLGSAFDDPSVIGAGGQILPRWPPPGRPTWMPDEFLWTVGCSYRGLPAAAAPIRNPIGTNMGFRSDVLERVGGFSGKLGRIGTHPAGCEETDLAIRARREIGGIVRYEPNALVTHTVSADRIRWSYFFRRCYQEGRSKALLARRVGLGKATSAERRHLLTLAHAVLRCLTRSITTGDGKHLHQAAALIAGTSATIGGFVAGMFAGRRAVPDPRYQP